MMLPIEDVFGLVNRRRVARRMTREYPGVQSRCCTGTSLSPV